MRALHLQVFGVVSVQSRSLSHVSSEPKQRTIHHCSFALPMLDFLWGGDDHIPPLEGALGPPDVVADRAVGGVEAPVAAPAARPARGRKRRYTDRRAAMALANKHASANPNIGAASV